MNSIVRNIPKVYLIIGVYISAVFLVMVFRHDVFTNYFTDPKAVFDANHYIDIATKGYHNSGVTAFYPLWPLVIRGLSVVFTSHSSLIIASNLTAFMLFLLALVPMFRLLRGFTSDNVAWAWVALYSLNPNSMFHALAYSESLFAFLLIYYLTETVGYFKNSAKRITLVWIFALAALISLTRPMLPIITACIVGAGFVRWVTHGVGALNIVFKHAFATLTGTLMGYSMYGLYCLQKFGNFWQPFAAQANWDRSIGLNWSLIHSPKSVSGSDNVLTWDFQAFWGPIILVIISAVFLFWKRTRINSAIDSLLNQYLFWFCLFFAFCHSMIAFLTYDIFMSTGRHVWGLPAFFIALALFFQVVGDSKWKTFAYRFYFFASYIYLGIWWARLAKQSWIG